jgi:hypothetical protein
MVSFAETLEDVRQSAEMLCNTENADKRSLDVHVSYLWDLVDSRKIIADTAHSAFSLARSANIKLKWDTAAFLAVLDHPQLEPFVDILEEEPTGDVIRLESQEEVLTYLGISRLEDIPDLLDRRAQELAQSLRYNLLNVDYDDPCTDGIRIEFISGDAPHIFTFCATGTDGVTRCAQIGAQALKGLLADALVALVVIAAIIAAVAILYGIWRGFKHLFRDRKGNAARRKIEDSSEATIASWDMDTIKMLLFGMMDDGTSNVQEDAILKVLRALGCERVIDELFFDSDVPHIEGGAVPARHGNWFTWIFNTMSGSQKSEFIDFLSYCGLLDPLFFVMSRDDIRNFVENADCGTLSFLSDEQLGTILRRTLDGDVGDRRETAIIKLFDCLRPCERIRSVLSTEGLSRRNFEDKVHGPEWEIFNSIFARCGI